MKRFNLRKAEPNELEELIAIDDKCDTLYKTVGLHFELDNHHPFVLDESRRWSNAINNGLAYVASDPIGRLLGFITLSYIDNEPYLDQLSAHPDNMRQGVGTKLLEFAVTWSGNQALWLTTYSHISWNKPFYEKRGFTEITEDSCGPELCKVIQKQRAALPSPEKRIAMAYRPNFKTGCSTS